MAVIVIGGAIALTIAGAIINPAAEPDDCAEWACANEGAPVAEWDR